uniref:Uncharacterized protein n=1 Tax=Timema poppense TaxID=170557 RepID=A0A7R9H2I5_TIMPO|nr:unnamed protein product [Timema poppensis]
MLLGYHLTTNKKRVHEFHFIVASKTSSSHYNMKSTSSIKPIPLLLPLGDDCSCSAQRGLHYKLLQGSGVRLKLLIDDRRAPRHTVAWLPNSGNYSGTDLRTTLSYVWELCVPYSVRSNSPVGDWLVSGSQSLTFM